MVRAAGTGGGACGRALGKFRIRKGAQCSPWVPGSAQGLGVSSHRAPALLAPVGFDLCRDKRVNCNVHSSAWFISTQCLFQSHHPVLGFRREHKGERVTIAALSELRVPLQENTTVIPGRLRWKKTGKGSSGLGSELSGGGIREAFPQGLFLSCTLKGKRAWSDRGTCGQREHRGGNLPSPLEDPGSAFDCPGVQEVLPHWSVASAGLAALRRTASSWMWTCMCE